MSDSTRDTPPVVAPEPFPSAAALRAAHNELLSREEDSAAFSSPFVAEVETFIFRGRLTGALLESDEERASSQSILNYWKSFLYGIRHKAPVATLDKFDLHLFPDPTKGKPSPYVGLSAFQEADCRLFFGRKRAVLDALERFKTSALLAVIGFSGSGKSSLVLAGVLPTLKAGGLPGSASWRYLGPMVPGSDPLLSLANAVTMQQGQETFNSTLGANKQKLLSDPKALLALIDDESRSPSLLVIDQFEEIFTLVGDDRQSEREAFCSNLVNLVSAPVANHKVIITMRGDKKGQLLKFPALLKLFRSSLIEVAELDSGELREAILEPADQVGLKFEEGIVDALVKEIIGEPAGLPLLQFTLLKLWDTREHSRVTWEGYRRLGGARKALGRSADELYTGLIPAEQVVAKRLILRLVRAGIGLEGDRNRVLRGSLLSLGNTDVVERVLDKLAEASLIRVVRVSNEGASPEDQIEVAHEALIRNWEALAGWLQDEQVAIRKRERLTQLADNWRARGEQRDDLLRGSLLYEAQAYSKEHPEDLNEFEKYFVRISGEEVELATKRQITEANKRAEENAQLAIEKARWARTLNLALLGLSVLTMLILVVAIVAWRLVDAKYRRSHASELSYKAIEVVNRNQAGGDYSPPGTIRAPLGLSLALKSVYVSYSQNRYLPNWGGKPGDDVPADSRWALDMATLAAAPKLSVADATYRPTSILFSSSGALAIAAGADGSLKVWEPAKEVPKTLEELGRPTQQSPVDATVYYSQHSFADPANRPPSPQCDPAHGDTPSLGRGLSFFDARALKAPTILVSEYATMRTAVSVHGDYLLSAGLDSRGTGAATIWKLRSGTGCRLRDLKLGSPVTAVAFASASDTLAIGNGNGLIELWKVEDEHNKTDFRPTSAPKKEQSDSGVQSIAFSPDDKFLVASFFDGTITVREVASGTEKFSRIQKPAIASVVFSPDKEHFVTTSLDGQFEIWSLDGSEPIHFAEHDHSEVPLVAFGSENATRFVSVWGTFATVWEKSGDNKWSELPNADRQVSLDPITAVSMSADGTQLLTADRDGFVGTHDLILDAAIKRAWKLNPQPLTTQQCNDMVGEPRQGECNDFYYDATYHKGVGSARDNARAVSHP